MRTRIFSSIIISAKTNRGIDDLFLDLTKSETIFAENSFFINFGLFSTEMIAHNQSVQEQTQVKNRNTMSGSGQRSTFVLWLNFNFKINLFLFLTNS